MNLYEPCDGMYVIIFRINRRRLLKFELRQNDVALWGGRASMTPYVGGAIAAYQTFLDELRIHTNQGEGVEGIQYNWLQGDRASLGPTFC